ncbi:methyltransferase domain-containing protein [Aeromicrobium sp. YIM 150415]|uniref:class I SAM-dependent methyltransferase n=1 Tax=Aeromicrobium sp. YIM 150415 TaxID=2803912 RepID=UPI0019630F31|nr:class I SAM-dependent methyltransferase [Aeromicrobium sp. YIM 150415]MBM9465328.1 methyltransferase domain-containing protein [Aeromicrobium sp. YIM 150415]
MSDDVRDFWDQRYGEREQSWSGRPNAALIDTAEDMPPGRALDLGAGEGGDAIWLARQGWQVTAVDISRVALDRAARAAAEAGIDAERIEWVPADLATWEPAGQVDLISACFFQSPVELPRDEVLRRLSGSIAPGGHLLVVSHASPPPWARDHEGHGPALRSAEEEVAALDLPSRDWEVLVAEDRPRAVTGPDGQEATIDDAVVLFGRR